MKHILALILKVPARHPALPLMSMWVCRTVLAAVVAFAAYIVLMHYNLWSLAVAWAIFAAFCLVIYLCWLIHSFRQSIKDDDGQAWIEPYASHMPYMPTMPPEQR